MPPMKIISAKHNLSGSVTVPGSKSHTIRALILATFAEGTSRIKNPLPSQDCLSAAFAVPLLGSSVDTKNSADGTPADEWLVTGAGKRLHLPVDVVNVGNSGSLLYFLSPVAATFSGWSIFTGDESIRKRPVNHVADALRQLGAQAFTARPQVDACPLLIKGPVSSYEVTTPGEVSSQYISGLMMAAILMKEKLTINLTCPKETPYLLMTKYWLEKVGVSVSLASDFSKISVSPCPPEKCLKAFDVTIPADWEAVAFPLTAAIITDSRITIEGVDSSGTQGDDAIVEILKSLGADLEWNKGLSQLECRGGRRAKDGLGRLTTQHLPQGELRVSMSPFPDAICALAVVACFTEGTVILEDASVCRRKETDRLSVLTRELKKLGVDISEQPDSLTIRGHAPLLPDGKPNPAFRLRGTDSAKGECLESYKDHRVAMALSCLGLGLPEGNSLTINNAECCSVSFPRFFETMNSLGANFTPAD